MLRISNVKKYVTVANPRIVALFGRDVMYQTK